MTWRKEFFGEGAEWAIRKCLFGSRRRVVNGLFLFSADYLELQTSSCQVCWVILEEKTISSASNFHFQVKNRPRVNFWGRLKNVSNRTSIQDGKYPKYWLKWSAKRSNWTYNSNNFRTQSHSYPETTRTKSSTQSTDIIIQYTTKHSLKGDSAATVVRRQQKIYNLWQIKRDTKKLSSRYNEIVSFCFLSYPFQAILYFKRFL